MMNIGSLDKTVFNSLTTLYYSDQEKFEQSLKRVCEFYNDNAPLASITRIYNYLAESNIDKSLTSEFIDMVFESMIDFTLSEDDFDKLLDVYKTFIFENEDVHTNDIVNNTIYDDITILIKQQCKHKVDFEQVCESKTRIVEHLSREKLDAVLENYSCDDIRYHTMDDVIKKSVDLFNKKYSNMTKFGKQLFKELKGRNKEGAENVIQQIHEEFVETVNEGLSNDSLSAIIKTNLQLALDKYSSVDASELNLSDVERMMQLHGAIKSH